MAEPVNFSVKERDNQVHYDISSDDLADCRDSDFSFQIAPAEDGKQKGVFRVTINGELVREQESGSFPEGTFEIRSQKKKSREVYRVELKKHGGAQIGEYFK